MTQIKINQISGGTISGVTYGQHQTIPHLIHYIDEGPADGFAQGYKHVSGYPFTNSIIWYTDNTMTKKIVEKFIYRNTINIPTSIVWNIYSTDGTTVVHTVTDNIYYTNNIYETSRQRTIV